MEKEQYRSVIRFLFLEGKSRSEIKERLDAVYGDSSPSMATIKNWFNEFQRGRTSVFDSTEDNVTKVHDLVLADCRLKIREIVETVGMSKDRVGHTLHEIGCRVRSLRDNKRNRETTSDQCLTLFKRNPKEFLRSFVTVDETWIHWYTHTPGTVETVDFNRRTSEVAKTVPSAGKVMATAFWDSQGVIYIDYLEKDKTVTGRRRHRGLFCRPRKNVFFRRVKEVGASQGVFYMGLI